eukprot:199994-Rhodomonas_salina.2
MGAERYCPMRPVGRVRYQQYETRTDAATREGGHVEDATRRELEGELVLVYSATAYASVLLRDVAVAVAVAVS